MTHLELGRVYIQSGIKSGGVFFGSQKLFLLANNLFTFPKNVGEVVLVFPSPSNNGCRGGVDGGQRSSTAQYLTTALCFVTCHQTMLTFEQPNEIVYII